MQVKLAEVVTFYCQSIEINSFTFFHVHTMHLDISTVFYSPTDAQVSCLKKTILKFTLKQV